MDKRLFPVDRDLFEKEIRPLIENEYIRPGRPTKVSHYHVFCAMLYVLRTGIPWRDLPQCYGYWHTVYLRFKRGSDRGVWWKIIMQLQQNRLIKMNIVIGDSTTISYHRHGGGLKGGSKAKASVAVE